MRLQVVAAALQLLLAPAVARAAMSPVQAAVMRGVSSRAAAASAAATAGVLAAFDDPTFRRMLKAALPEAASTLDPAAPATELMSRYRAEVAVAEAVHSFRSTGQPWTQMSVPEAMNATGAKNLWQFQIMAEALGPGNATAAQLNADHAGFGGMNTVEEGMFGFPAFTGSRNSDPAWEGKSPWPASMAEASDRPLWRHWPRKPQLLRAEYLLRTSCERVGEKSSLLAECLLRWGSMRPL